jgi:hypothetical protein
MKLGKFKVSIIIIVLAATLSILFGGKSIYYQYNIERPMQKKLSQIKEIKKFTISKKASELILEVQLNKTNNLQNTYLVVQNQTKEVLGDREYTIKMLDNPDKVLEDIFYHAQFDIFEAIEKGEYSKMINRIEARSKKAGVTTKVFIDNDYLLLQMEHGKSYLYKSFPRSNDGTLSQVGGEERGTNGNG